MRRKMLNFLVGLVLFSLTVLWLLPNSDLVEGGGWTTTAGRYGQAIDPSEIYCFHGVNDFVIWVI